jgi:hypothetical protein
LAPAKKHNIFKDTTVALSRVFMHMGIVSVQGGTLHCLLVQCHDLVNFHPGTTASTTTSIQINVTHVARMDGTRELHTLGWFDRFAWSSRSLNQQRFFVSWFQIRNRLTRHKLVMWCGAGWRDGFAGFTPNYARAYLG